MNTIKSMGDLRMFLVETMQGVRGGTVDCAQAGQVAKLAVQINSSIHAEIAARTHLGLKNERAFNDLAMIESSEKPDDDTESDVKRRESPRGEAPAPSKNGA